MFLSRLRTSLALVALLGSQTACQKATFQADPSTPASSRGAESFRWTNFFLFGLIGESTLDVTEFCPVEQVLEVSTRLTFLNGLVGGITLGIYTPRTVKVVCAGSGSASARQLEIWADAEGKPVKARLTVDGESSEASVQSASGGAWLVSPKG
jgi:hypothetical protein